MVERQNSSRDDDGRVVVLTGAAGGLGRVTAVVLLEDGYRVALVDRDERGLGQVMSGLPDDLRPGAEAFIAEITDEGHVERLVRSVITHFGRLDVLVNNAGIEPPMAFDDADMGVWDRTFEVNIRAAMLLIKHCLPQWRRQESGTVVCVGSRTSLSGSSSPAYVSSKAAIVGLVRGITSHLGHLGINANVVAPSFVPSPLNDQKWSSEYIDSYARSFVEATPLARLIEPVDVAYAVSFLASHRARNISGEIIHIAAGSQLAPTVR
jgi:3-oxoacyl-[acyl-carrier protein] reductase